MTQRHHTRQPVPYMPAEEREKTIKAAFISAGRIRAMTDGNVLTASLMEMMIDDYRTGKDTPPPWVTIIDVGIVGKITAMRAETTHCDECKGKGYIDTLPCSACDTRGFISRRITVVRNGQPMPEWK